MDPFHFADALLGVMAQRLAKRLCPKYELLAATDPIKQLIQEHTRASAVHATAVSEGMRTLKQDGIEKVLQGHTNMHAVRAVCIK